MRLEKKTTATLLIAAFMISIFAVVIPVSAVEEYSYSKNIDIEGSDSDLVLTVTADGDWVTWTFDFPVEEWTGEGNLNVGLVIALEGDGYGPAFQIHNNDGATSAYLDGTWLMSPWGPTITDGWFGWHSGDTNILVSGLARGLMEPSEPRYRGNSCRENVSAQLGGFLLPDIQPLLQGRQHSPHPIGLRNATCERVPSILIWGT